MKKISEIVEKLFDIDKDVDIFDEPFDQMMSNYEYKYTIKGDTLNLAHPDNYYLYLNDENDTNLFIRYCKNKRIKKITGFGVEFHSDKDIDFRGLKFNLDESLVIESDKPIIVENMSLNYESTLELRNVKELINCDIKSLYFQLQYIIPKVTRCKIKAFDVRIRSYGEKEIDKLYDLLENIYLNQSTERSFLKDSKFNFPFEGYIVIEDPHHFTAGYAFSKVFTRQIKAHEIKTIKIEDGYVTELKF